MDDEKAKKTLESTNSLLSKISEVIPQSHTPNTEKPTEEGIYLFFSLDLSNSTQFKAEHPTLWAFVISSFYEAVNFKLVTYQTALQQWKLIGDEVLLYKEVVDGESIYEDVKSVYIALQDIIERMIANTSKNISEILSKKCNHPCDQTDDVEYAIRSTLGIKATAWIAQCCDPSHKGRIRNIIYENGPSTTGSSRDIPRDFLGPDIDEGFRLCKFAVKNQMVVSPLLAHIIYKLSQSDQDKQLVIENNFHITSFEQLKGIWQSRAVPIVMYCPDFKNLFDRIEYDQIDLPTYSNIRHTSLKEFLSNSRYNVSYLEKIFDNLARSAEIKSLIERIENLQKPSGPTLLSSFELHIACAVVTADHKLLIHVHEKRGLEFGGFHFYSGQYYSNWNDFCHASYQTKYNLSISVDDQPVPINTYCYTKSKNNTALGIIIPAHFSGDIAELPSDWEAVGLQDLQRLEADQSQCVDHFFENAKKALSLDSEETV